METSTNSASGLAADPLLPQPPGVATIVGAGPRIAVTEELILKVAELSASIFPGPIHFETTNDPENPSSEYVVFDVVAEGEYVDYRERIFQWHDEVDRLVGGPTSEFRLIVHPKP